MRLLVGLFAAAVLAGDGGIVVLSPGVTLLDAPLAIRVGVRQVRGHPAGSVLRMRAGFKGKAAVVVEGVEGVTLSSFRIEGDRAEMRTDKYLPHSHQAFAEYYEANGILALRARGVTIQDVAIARVRSFGVLVTASHGVTIERIRIANSGTLNASGRNNTTGGILIEEGASKFVVRDCVIERIAGNGIWTHSNYTSPRNADGVFTGNTITGSARDALQVGHATRVRVERNRGSRIGYPAEWVDVEAHANPVALDTAGDVDNSVYRGNHFTEVNGHCIDLDGFHDGQVLDNSCSNTGPLDRYPYLHYGILFGNTNPDMRPENVVVAGNVIRGFGYGAVYVIGSGNIIVGNRFIDMNRNRCTGDMTRSRCNYAPDQPDMLRSGIYMARGAARESPATGNVIRDNVLQGFGMDRWCVRAAPGVDLAWNEIARNQCRP